MAEAQPDLEGLAQDVRYLKDRFGIIDAIHRYSRGIDRLDAELLQSAYHPDAIDDRGPFTGSPEQFVAWVFPHIAGANGTAHNISNITCEIDGDQAHTETYITFAVWSDERQKVFLGGGRYLDRLERRDGRWAILRRETIQDWIIEAPANALPPGVLEGRRDRADRSYLRPLDPTDAALQRLKAGR